MNKHLEILKKLKIKYKNEIYYLEALTHPSFVNEHKVDHDDYQRLEFVGDAVVGLTVADYIYNKCKDMSEGQLTVLRAALVRKETLSELSKIIHLEDYTYVGHGGDQEIKDNPKFLCDIFEALVGAIYMDLGFAKAKSFVMQQLGAYINQVGINNLIVTSKDFKSRLQELVQADTKRTVEYVCGLRSHGTGTGG
jgi:ribonuclease-3